MSLLLLAISQQPQLPPSHPNCLPAYMHTSFNSNRKTKWREKGEVPDQSVFPAFPLK